MAASARELKKKTDEFSLHVTGQGSIRLAGGWLKLGVASLFVAGIYALLLVVARTPYVKGILPGVDFFYIALVVHVVFSNLFWFLTIAGVLWSMNSADRFVSLGWVALILTSVGVGIIALSPLAGAGEPVMANYIPFLNDPVFLAGLALFGFGFALLVLRAMISIPRLHVRTMEGSLRFGIYTSANTSIMAVLAFGWAFIVMPRHVPESYYEALFWLGGHLLQFTHALLMLAAWMWLAAASGIRLRISPRAVTLLFTLALFTVAFTPIAFLSMNVASISFQKWFTTHMQIGGAAATLPLGLAVLWSLFGASKPEPEVRPLRTALWLSILLFALGGGLGYMLRESNTLVTAHYHSVTGAVTLAFMALVYVILPRLGFRSVSPTLARLQVYAFGIGQLLHVLGLAWAGGYGMQRKVGGSAQAADNLQQLLGMSLMGIGGLIATIGGILFLYAVISAMWRSKYSLAKA